MKPDVALALKPVAGKAEFIAQARVSGKAER